MLGDVVVGNSAIAGDQPCFEKPQKISFVTSCVTSPRDAVIPEVCPISDRNQAAMIDELDFNQRDADYGRKFARFMLERALAGQAAAAPAAARTRISAKQRPDRVMPYHAYPCLPRSP